MSAGKGQFAGEFALLARGVEQRGLFFREWEAPRGFLTAVGEVPEVGSIDQVGLFALTPGSGDTRTEALRNALTSWLKNHATEPLVEQGIPEPAQIAINGLFSRFARTE